MLIILSTIHNLNFQTLFALLYFIVDSSQFLFNLYSHTFFHVIASIIGIIESDLLSKE